MNTRNCHSGVFVTAQTWFTHTYNLQRKKSEPYYIVLPGTIIKAQIRNIC